MASQLIGTTETGWFNPGVNPPPFDMKLLLMVAGSHSEDCGKTFEPYTVVMTAYVQQQGRRYARMEASTRRVCA